MQFVTAAGMLHIFSQGINVLWVAAIVIFLVIEAATAGLTCIWFALGSLAALVAALFGAQLWLQVVWFFVVSLAALYFTRPLVKKYVNAKRQPTNADMLIGMEARVTEDIDNTAGAGAVSVSGKVWTARSADGEPIAASSIVRVERIEGVKLIVSRHTAAE